MSLKYLRVCSDLHLEGFSGRDPATLMVDFLPSDDRDGEAVLVLAGDISSDPNQLMGFLKACEPKFKRVIYVPGNHELYRHNFDAWNRTMRERFDEHLVNTEATVADEVRSVVLHGVRFIFGTMWGDGGPTLADQGSVGHYLNDFRLITRDPLVRGYGHPTTRKFMVSDMKEIFRTSKARLNELLKEPFEGKTVVITHHLPSRRLVSARFWPKDGSDGANGGFVGQCDDILANDHAPSLWIFGHTHDRVSSKLWNTRVECNPAGYRGEWATSFNTFMRAELRADGTKRAVVVPVFVSMDDMEVALPEASAS